MINTFAGGVWVHYHAAAAAYSRPQLARLSTALEGHGPGPATPGQGGGGGGGGT